MTQILKPTLPGKLRNLYFNISKKQKTINCQNPTFWFHRSVFAFKFGIPFEERKFFSQEYIAALSFAHNASWSSIHLLLESRNITNKPVYIWVTQTTRVADCCGRIPRPISELSWKLIKIIQHKLTIWKYKFIIHKLKSNKSDYI